MRIQHIAILIICALFTGSCGKSPTPPTANAGDRQPAPAIQAEAFHGQVYKSGDGRTVLTLISKDECELNERGTIFLCKYTKPNDTLRIVTTALGTSQVVYYRFTSQGLEDKDGNVLFSQLAAEAQNSCINNLRQIDGAKQQWALDKKKASSDTPTEREITPYLANGIDKCPAGGVYTLNAVDSAPTCSIAGHMLPP